MARVRPRTGSRITGSTTRNRTPLEDVSSTAHGGFWWAHLRWLYQTTPADIKRWAPDLDKAEYRFWGYSEAPIVVLSIFGGLVFGWEAFFWLGAIRLVYSLHLQCFVNSITHMGETWRGRPVRQELVVAGPAAAFGVR